MIQEQNLKRDFITLPAFALIFVNEMFPVILHYFQTTFKSLWMACPTTNLPFKMSATSFCTVRTSSPAVTQTHSDEKLAHLMKAVCHLRGSPAAFCCLTIFDIRWSNAADGRPVVRHPLCGLHKLVVDAFSKLVDEGHASQDAVLSIVTHSHHLAVDGHDFGDADG